MIVHILFNAYFNRGYDCDMIGHTQFFLWSRYSDIISLLTITLRWGEGGYQISIAYCLFSLTLLAKDSYFMIFHISYRGNNFSGFVDGSLQLFETKCKKI